MAKKVGTEEAIISKILRYNVDEFTIDRLVKFLAALYPGAEVKIEVAS
ncbi:MAG: XRE family transcriptional regulator [Deltaproteobacteria bacterium]|nr:XRE family transcriptional regulator [Deltaproteobacteria bacterium]